MTKLFAKLALASAVLALSGCVEDLDPPGIVVTPRILAIVAEAPESAPGVDVEVDAMISIPAEVARPLTLRWEACLDPQSVLRASGFRNIEVEGGGAAACDPQTLAEGEPYVVRGERTGALLTTLRAAAMIGGFDISLIESVLATAGLAYFVDVDVLDANGDLVVSGYKRVAMTTRESPTTNPPPPTFRVDELEIAISERFVCRTADGVVPTFPAATAIELAPTLADGATEEPWIESFPIFDYTGGLTIAQENAYYTWYATAGSIGEHTTRPPDRETTWTTPTEAGPHTLWLVVRDGHLGQSACRLDVLVGP